MKILNAESVLKAMSGTSASHVLLYSAIAYTGQCSFSKGALWTLGGIYTSALTLHLHILPSENIHTKLPTYKMAGVGGVDGNPKLCLWLHV